MVIKISEFTTLDDKIKRFAHYKDSNLVTIEHHPFRIFASQMFKRKEADRRVFPNLKSCLNLPKRVNDFLAIPNRKTKQHRVSLIQKKYKSSLQTFKILKGMILLLIFELLAKAMVDFSQTQEPQVRPKTYRLRSLPNFEVKMRTVEDSWKRW